MGERQRERERGGGVQFVPAPPARPRIPVCGPRRSGQRQERKKDAVQPLSESAIIRIGTDTEQVTVMPNLITDCPSQYLITDPPSQYLITDSPSQYLNTDCPSQRLGSGQYHRPSESVPNHRLSESVPNPRLSPCG